MRSGPVEPVFQDPPVCHSVWLLFLYGGPGQSPVLPFACCVAVFRWPLWPVCVLVLFPHQRSPVVGTPGVCWLVRGSFYGLCCPLPSALRSSTPCLPRFRVRAAQHVHPSIRRPGGPQCASQPQWHVRGVQGPPPLRGSRVCMARSLMVGGGMRYAGGVRSFVVDAGGLRGVPGGVRRTVAAPLSLVQPTPVYSRVPYLSSTILAVQTALHGSLQWPKERGIRARTNNGVGGLRQRCRGPSGELKGTASPARTTHKPDRCLRSPSGGPLGAGSPGHVRNHLGPPAIAVSSVAGYLRGSGVCC